MANAAITVDLNAKIANFETELKKATGSLDRFEKKGSQVAAGFKSAFAGLAAVVSVGAIASFAKSGIDAADALNDLSDRVGVSVKDLASFKLAAELADTSLEGVGKGISRLSRSIGDAEGGNKKLAETLKTLGISARDPKEAFFQLADATQRIQDPATRAALLNQVLGKSYEELVPLLQQGGDALRESAKASDSFAESMAKLAPDAGKFNDQLDVLKQNAAGAAASILSELVPSFNEWIAVGKEVIETGTLLDKVRFFGLGNASDDITNRVRIMSSATAGWANTLKKSAGEFGADEPTKRPAATSSKKTSGDKAKTFDAGAMVSDDIAAAWRAADEELKRYAEDRAFVFEGDLARDNVVSGLSEEWAEAGRALRDEMMTPLEKFNIEMGRLDMLLEKGSIDFETYSRALFDGLDKTETKVRETNQAAKELGLTFASAFEDAIVDGKKFSDVLKGLAQDLLRIAARKAITEPLADWASKAVANLIPSANGNVFNNSPALSAYSGSIVSNPTVFPFAKGVGLMGEAGPEAILPLKRGSNGKLGVSMEGGGGGVTVNNYIDARGADAGAEQRIRRAMAETEDRAVSRSVTQVQNMNQRGQLRLS